MGKLVMSIVRSEQNEKDILTLLHHAKIDLDFGIQGSYGGDEVDEESRLASRRAITLIEDALKNGYGGL